jgi:hypothetical protein
MGTLNDDKCLGGMVCAQQQDLTHQYMRAQAWQIQRMVQSLAELFNGGYQQEIVAGL